MGPDEVILANTRVYWGRTWGNLEDRDKLLGVKVHPVRAFLGSWGGAL